MLTIRNIRRHFGCYGFSDNLPRFTHPSRDALARAQHERTAEGAVSAEAALLGQLLGDDGLAGLGSLLTTADEIVDAQVVDIGVVGDALAGEILAQI